MRIIKTLKNIFSSVPKKKSRKKKSYTFPKTLLDRKHSFAIQAKHLYQQNEKAGNFALQLAKLAIEAYGQEPLWAMEAMKAAMDLSPRDNYRKWLGFRLFDHGNIRDSHAILSSLPESVFRSTSEQNRWNFLRGCYELLDEDLPIPDCTKPVISQSGRLLYVASSSIMYQTTGYTVRTHELLKELIRQGINVLCVTQPDSSFTRKDVSMRKESVIDGVPYCVLSGPHHRKISLKEYLEQFSQILEKTIRDFAPVAVQAASNYETGLPALLAARSCGLPFAYEVRGFEEYTAASYIQNFEDSDRFLLDKRLETYTSTYADAVFTLNASMSEELKNRGIEERKIHLLPNAINLEEIHRIERESALRTQLGFSTNDFVIGFIGSVVKYEGLDDLLSALATLLPEHACFKLLIIGTGNALEELKLQAEKLEISQHVKFIDSVPHADVAHYYAQMDAAVLPRKPEHVGQLVSPLKVYEIMAYGVPLIVSDVKAMAEMVEKDHTALLFESGNYNDLAKKLYYLFSHSEVAKELRENALHSLVQKSWKQSANAIMTVYRNLPGSQNAMSIGVNHTERHLEQTNVLVRQNESLGTVELEKRRIEALIQKNTAERELSRAKALLSRQEIQINALKQKIRSGVREESGKTTTRKIPQPTELNEEQQIWQNTAVKKAEGIQESNGCRYYIRSKLRIGIICDEFFYDSISASANFIYLTPDNWQEQLEQGLDAFFYVSAWRGLHDEWKGSASLKYQERQFFDSLLPDSLRDTPKETHSLHAVVMEIIKTCRKKNIPTLFYSKEDPPNFWNFAEFSQYCDYVFTSCIECVETYRQFCGHDRVRAVCFGINPTVHNPIGCHQTEKEREVLFSGSWMEKYPKRCEGMSKIFDGILEAGYALHIIDRNYPDNRRYSYPAPYYSHVSRALPHGILQKVHKTADWAVNINTIQDSDTMFANRAFELQANGVLLLSNYSVGVNSLLPNIAMVEDMAEVDGILSCMTEEEMYERQMMGVRAVMTGHTCFDRLSEFLKPLGLDYVQPVRKILVLADEMTEAVQACFDRQTYPEKTLKKAGEVKEEELLLFDMVTWFAADSCYEEFYLEDMANAFKYTACSYVTKDAWLDGKTLHEGVEHDYVCRITSKYRTLFWREDYEPKDLLHFVDRAEYSNGYSIDHLNYNAQGMMQHHAQKDYLLSVVVAVYNNGLHLYGKCFSSLRRSSMFEDMEIILVDDGSTDGMTRKIENWLVRHYDNVRIYAFDDGGSGSASRPRNKGVELATAPWLTFLDPDNEAVCDGYAVLYKKACLGNYDVVMGNMYKIDTDARLLSYYHNIVSLTGVAASSAQHDAFHRKTKFLSPSIQAMVIRREFLQRSGLQQVVGAAGQDTLFAWQLIDAAASFFVKNIPVHIYYAQTANSVTNTVSARFFRKLSLLQQEKLDFLVESGKINDFMKLRYDKYTKEIVLRKLAMVKKDDVAESVGIVWRMHQMYAPYYKGTMRLINDFAECCADGRFEDAYHLVKNEFGVRVQSPIPALKEMFSVKDRESEMDILYEQKNMSFTFYNETETAGRTVYQWILKKNSPDEDVSVVQTKFSEEKMFMHDFSSDDNGIYKLTAIIKTENEKLSEVVAVIKKVEETFELLENFSFASLKQDYSHF